MSALLTMTGHDRTYLPPRSIRRSLSSLEDIDPVSARIALGNCTAWDLLRLDGTHPASTWAIKTLDSITAAGPDLGCGDCEDTGFYGLASTGDVDLLDGLLRRVGDGEYESLRADGIWEAWTGDDSTAEILSLEIAADVADALTAGASGLLRKYSWPLFFLPPEEVVSANLLSSLIGAGEDDTPRGEWVNFGVVDDDDPGAVMAVVRVGSEDQMEIYSDGEWEPWEDASGDLYAIPLDDEALEAVLTASGLLAYVSPNPKAEKLRRYWSTGRGGTKIRWRAGGDFTRCVRQLRKYLGLRAKGYCANLHRRNTGMWPGDRRNRRGRLLSSAIEENLVAALQSGEWTGEPEGNSDMTVAELKDGIYCEVDDNASIMQTITAGGFPVAPPDEWYKNPEFSGHTPMQVDDDGRVYGHIATFDVTHIGMAGAIYAPKSKSNYAYFMTGALKTASGKQVNVGQLTLSGGHAPLHADAGAAVKHYDDTSSAVADVAVGEDAYGIWAAGSLRPSITPEQVRVFRASPLSGDWRPINGNLELVAACAVNVPGFPIARARVAGGAILALVAAGARPLAVRRASLTADAAVLERLDSLEARIPAVAEVETLPVTVTPDTSSADAEVEVVPTTAEPTPATAEVTLNESIAAPEVEPVAASTAVAEAPVLEEQVEEAVAAAEQDTPEEVQPEVADKLDPEQVKQAREDAKAIRRDWLRRQVHGDDDAVTAAIPPQFLKNVKKSSDKKIAETERKGGGYPIKDEASLKDAIQAVGRAKPEDRAKTIAHIKSAAAKLGLTKLLPKTAGW